MSIIRWEDPPPAAHGGPGRGKLLVSHELIAVQLRREPGRWALIIAADALAPAAVASGIKRGLYRPYAPAGAYDAVFRSVNGEGRVYARYVGEDAS